GTARPLLRPGGGTGRTADCRPDQRREHGVALRGGALLARPWPSRSAGGALRDRVVCAQRRHRLPPVDADRGRRIRRDNAGRGGGRPVVAACWGGGETALRADRSGRARAPDRYSGLVV